MEPHVANAAADLCVRVECIGPCRRRAPCRRPAGGSGLKRLSAIRCSIVMGWPGSKVLPQRNPGENAVSAPLAVISASRMSCSMDPLKLPRR